MSRFYVGRRQFTRWYGLGVLIVVVVLLAGAGWSKRAELQAFFTFCASNTATITPGSITVAANSAVAQTVNGTQVPVTFSLTNTGNSEETVTIGYAIGYVADNSPIDPEHVSVPLPASITNHVLSTLSPLTVNVPAHESMVVSTTWGIPLYAASGFYTLTPHLTQNNTLVSLPSSAVPLQINVRSELDRSVIVKQIAPKIETDGKLSSTTYLVSVANTTSDAQNVTLVVSPGADEQRLEKVVAAAQTEEYEITLAANQHPEAHLTFHDFTTIASYGSFRTPSSVKACQTRSEIHRALIGILGGVGCLLVAWFLYKKKKAHQASRGGYL
jgi:hypothetical protein